MANIKLNEVIVNQRVKRQSMSYHPRRPAHNLMHNTTNRLLLQACRVNCDFKLLHDPVVMIDYTTKYVTKKEESSSIFHKVLKNVTAKHKETKVAYLQSVVLGISGERDVSSQEVAF